MPVQGAGHGRSERGLGGHGSNPAEVGVTLGSTSLIAGGYCHCVGSAADVTVILLTGHFGGS